MATTTSRTTARTRTTAAKTEEKPLTRAQRSAANKAAFAAARKTTAKPKPATEHVANQRPARAEVVHEVAPVTRTKKLTVAERKAKQVERETLALELAAKAYRLSNYSADQLALPQSERRLDPPLKFVLGYASTRKRLEAVEQALATL